MPGQKRPPKSAEGGPVLVLLEEIRSQNCATLEAVEAHRQEFRPELQDFRGEARGDIGTLRSALQGVAADVRQLKADVAALKEQVARTDAVITADYLERLHRLEQRVEALERSSAAALALVLVAGCAARESAPPPPPPPRTRPPTVGVRPLTTLVRTALRALELPTPAAWGADARRRARPGMNA